MGDFKAAARSLLSTPGPTLVVVATLAVAIGANTAIFSIVEGVLLRPLGYGDDSRLVVLSATSGSGESEMFHLSPADYRDLRDGAEAFEGQVVLYRSIGSTLTDLEPPLRVGSLSITPRVFRVLDVEPAAGRFFSDEDERPGSAKKVVLTYGSWIRRFGGDPAIVGSTIELDSEPYTVLGVAEPGFSFPPGNNEVELYFPMALSDAVLLDRNHRMFDAIARLADGYTLEAARAELRVLSDRLAREFPDTNQGWSLVARPLREELLGDVGTTLRVLSGAVFLVLLIACANVANVLVARSTVATRELAVRSAMGARASDLCRRSLAEASMLGVLGASGGVLLALWGVGLLRGVLPAGIFRAADIAIDGTVLWFAAGLSAGATVLFGLLPTLGSLKPNLLDLLRPSRGTGTTGLAGRRLRESMVVVQVALAIVLLVGAGLMMRGFARLGQVDPGFRKEGVVSVAVRLPSSRYGRTEWKPFFERLVDRMASFPGVKAAGAVSDLPMSDVGLGFEMEFTIPGLDALLPTARPNADFRLMVPGYFEAMGMRIVRGRDLDRLDAASDRIVAIVNETLVDRYFSGVDPIGRSVRLEMLGAIEIVGVVSNVRHQGLQGKHESEIYLPYGRLSTAEMHVVVQSELGAAAVAGAFGDVLREMDPELAPSRVAAISDLLWDSVAEPRFNTTLLTGLALAAALLAVVGTYGIVAYSVSQRTGEIGMRMALGADAKATVLMVLRHALGIVLLGTAGGLVAALGTTRWLSHMLFGVSPADPLTYVVVLAASCLVGAVAAFVPARRATRVEPVAAIRGE